MLCRSPLLLPAHGPVPLRLTLCGLLGSLPTVTAMVAVSGEPPPVGVNFTASPQLVWAATVGHDPPAAKSPAFAPLKLSLTGSATPELLVIVTVFDFVG